MPEKKKCNDGPLARWPSPTEPCEQGPGKVDGLFPVRARVCPWLRWAHFKHEWCWWCEVRQRCCEGKAHLLTEDHAKEAAKQREA
eukprot:9498832-Pyramimonas_sp.AAC.1